MSSLEPPFRQAGHVPLDLADHTGAYHQRLLPPLRGRLRTRPRSETSCSPSQPTTGSHRSGSENGRSSCTHPRGGRGRQPVVRMHRNFARVGCPSAVRAQSRGSGHRVVKVPHGGLHVGLVLAKARPGIRLRRERPPGRARLLLTRHAGAQLQQDVPGACLRLSPGRACRLSERAARAGRARGPLADAVGGAGDS